MSIVTKIQNSKIYAKNPRRLVSFSALCFPVSFNHHIDTAATDILN